MHRIRVGYLWSRGYGAVDLGQEMTIYNVLGDPTVEIKTRAPIAFGALEASPSTAPQRAEHC